jgi:hypothetical protein
MKVTAAGQLLRLFIFDDLVDGIHRLLGAVFGSILGLLDLSLGLHHLSHSVHNLIAVMLNVLSITGSISVTLSNQSISFIFDHAAFPVPSAVPTPFPIHDLCSILSYLRTTSLPAAFRSLQSSAPRTVMGPACAKTIGNWLFGGFVENE